MDLTDLELDGVREVMMIGGGHASTALSKILKREIDINIPVVEFSPLEDVPEKMGGLENLSIGVYAHIMKDLDGRLLTLFSKQDALRLSAMLTGKEIVELREVSEETVALIADVLASSTIGAISDFFGMEIEKTQGETAYDMLGALLEQVLVDIGQKTDSVLFSKTEIYVSSEKFNCLQTLFLEAQSLDVLLAKLDVKL